MFWRRVLYNAFKTVYFYIGLIFTIISLIPLFPATWYGDWGRWLLLGVGLVMIFLWSPFKVWDKTEKEQVRLQSEIDSRQSNVELTDYCDELQYTKMKPPYGKPTILLRLRGILRNSSPQNSGSLDYFIVNILTDKGFYRAECNNPSRGFRFEPNFVHESDQFDFIGDLSDPLLDIESWEPLIRGKRGQMILQVQGQDIKAYSIKVANKEG